VTYPVALLLQGRRVLVVGGGRVAAQKVAGLLAGGADDVTVVAPEVDPSIAGPGVTVERRAYRRGEAGDGYRLVLAATDDRAVNQQVFDDAEAAGVWCNSADDPERCSFHVNAVVRRGPVTVSIGTQGTTPALATWLRRRFEAELGEEYVTLAQLLAEHRDALRSEGTPTEGLPWQEVLDGGLLDLIRAGRTDEARERLSRCR